MTTIKDIAAYTGVSPTTVSYALNGRKEVSKGRNPAKNTRSCQETELCSKQSSAEFPKWKILCDYCNNWRKH